MPECWHQTDDRKCEDDEVNNSWSLFCALKFASLEKAKEYNHHNTAIQTVRFVIDDLHPNHGYKHTLMDYNNNPKTTHSEILEVVREAKKKIEIELKNSRYTKQQHTTTNILHLANSTKTEDNQD
jgi:hypothetical protein